MAMLSATEHKFCFEISDIIDTKKDGTIGVVIKQTGKTIFFKRNQAEFFWKRCCIPLWLAKKINLVNELY